MKENIKKFKLTEIGMIPKEWEIVNIKDIADVKGGKRLPKGHKLVEHSTPYPYLRVVDFKNMSIDINNIKYLSFETHKLIKQYTISSNDAYISIAGSVGIVGLIPQDLDRANLTENAAKLCNLKEIMKEFLAYMLNSHIGQEQINAFIGKAQQPKLALFRIEKIKLPLPPLAEQKKIAVILLTVDEAIEKIDKAVKKTQRLKKGLMQELLTKGIRHTEFKETEIGRIPKEWEIVKLIKIAKVRYGLGQPPELEANGIPMIRATNIKSGKIINEDLIYVKKSKIPISRNPYLKEGDILIVRSGAYTGDIALITRKWEGAIAGYDLVITPSDSIDSHFLTYLLLSSFVQKIYFVGLKVRSAQPHLNSSQVEKTPIPLPPLPEQQKIAEILSTVDCRLEMLRKRKGKIERIKKGLMNDLLTGRKRVKLDS